MTVQETYDSLKVVYEAKNHDYGNSFDKSLDKYGLIAALTRMSDKFNRAENIILGQEVRIKDESIIDTLLDLANYAVMTAVYIKNNTEKNGD